MTPYKAYLAFSASDLRSLALAMPAASSICFPFIPVLEQIPKRYSLVRCCKRLFALYHCTCLSSLLQTKLPQPTLSSLSLRILVAPSRATYNVLLRYFLWVEGPQLQAVLKRQANHSLNRSRTFSVLSS